MFKLASAVKFRQFLRLALFLFKKPARAIMAALSPVNSLSG